MGLVSPWSITTKLAPKPKNWPSAWLPRHHGGAGVQTYDAHGHGRKFRRPRTTYSAAAATIQSEDFKEGMAFMEKREAKFTGR